MMEPKGTKYSKVHKPYVKQGKLNYKNYYPVLGIYSLKSMESGIISSKELEGAKGAILKKLKKRGKVIINVFPDQSVTSLPSEVRMGKGKGRLSGWVCLIKGGGIVFEIISDSVSETLIKKVLGLAGEGLSLKTKYVKGIV